MFSHGHSHGEVSNDDGCWGGLGLHFIILQESQNYAQRIRDMEETIQALTIRCKSLEAAVDLDDLPEEKQQDLELELADIRKVLEASKTSLVALQKKNRQSFIVAAILFFICFLVYGIYVLFVGVW